MVNETREWKVIATRAYDPGTPAEGETETVLASGPEEEARRVYADEVAVAAERGHRRVFLRHGGEDVDTWPPATGWTS